MMNAAPSEATVPHEAMQTLDVDVRVCGAGVAGTMAAVAAARAGAKVLLLERYGFLGGNGTAGAVAQFNSWQTANGRRIVQVRALTKSGIVAIRPQVLIDNSGDMDALRKAGASFLSLDEHESLQPATMMFRFGPIDFVALESADIGALARAALHVARDPFSQNGWFNVSRLAIDAIDAMALGRAEIEGRQQAWNAAKFLRHSVPGCADGRLQAFGTQVGIRETRRVQGDHVLSAEELLAPVDFDDAIAAGAYPIDRHPVAGANGSIRRWATTMRTRSRTAACAPWAWTTCWSRAAASPPPTRRWPPSAS